MTVESNESELLNYLFNEAKCKKISGTSLEKNGPFIKITELLEKNLEIVLSQEHQKIIAENFRMYLPSVRGITVDTMISFCKPGSFNERTSTDFRRLQDSDVAILFKTYLEQIKPRLDEFMQTGNITDLKIALMAAIRGKESVLRLMDDEALSLYNNIISDCDSLNYEDIKTIVASNPSFIINIKNPSPELQLIAISKSENKLGVLKCISSPCDEVLATLLIEFKYDDFGDRFKDGVPSQIIDLVIEKRPIKAFHGMEDFKVECSLQQKMRALEVNPNMLPYLELTLLSPELIIREIEIAPQNIGIIGERFGIYVQSLSDLAMSLKNNFDGDAKEKLLETIQGYQAVIDERNSLNETYAKLVKEIKPRKDELDRN